MSDIVNALQNHRIVMFTASEKQYDRSFAEVTAQAQNIFSRIAVLSYRTPFSVLESHLAKAGVKTKNCFFIDVLSAKKKSNAENILFVQSPSDLNELSPAVNALLASNAFQAMIFDNPEAMLRHQEYKVVLQFVHNLIMKCRVAGIQLTLFTMEADLRKQLVKDLHLFVDAVVDLNTPASQERLAEAFK